MSIKKLFDFPEGKILLIGVMTALLFFIWLNLSYVWYPDKMQLFYALTGARIVFGRAAGLYSGFVMELTLPVNFLIHVVIDTAWTLIFYPIVIFSLRNLLFIKALHKGVERIRKVAESHQAQVKRYGVVGLFLFVLCPLPMTGPIVGGVIGNFMGLRPSVNMSIGLSATYVAIIFWIVVYKIIYYKALEFNPLMPFMVFVLLVVAGFILQFVAKKFSRR